MSWSYCAFCGWAGRTENRDEHICKPKKRPLNPDLNKIQEDIENG